MSVGALGRRGASAALGLLLLAGLGAPAARGIVWRGGTGALLGGAGDSNPLEAISAAGRRTDPFARFEAAVWARGVAGGGGSGPAFGLRGGADRYLRQRREDRILLSGSAGWRWVHPGGSTGLSYGIYSRAFPRHAVRDAVRHEVQLTRERRLGDLGRWRARALGVALEGRRGGPRPRRSGALRFELEGGSAGPVLARATLEAGLTAIERPVLARAPGGAVSTRRGEQRDRWLYLGAAARALGPPFVEVTWGVRRLRSNSYGYSFGRFEGSLLLAGMLAQGVSGQLLANLERPLYDDALAAIDPLEDAEDRELGARNGVTLRLLRPLAEGLTGELRVAWQHDESLILQDFYDKTVWILAVRYGAGEPELPGF
jgi:hypothetical protein